MDIENQRRQWSNDIYSNNFWYHDDG